MQILEIVIYSRHGKKRVVPLRPGAVNLITGRSHTGKSALIYIVSYCLGGSSCHIPEGRILEASSWFGLLLDFGKERVFLARENAYPRHLSTNRMFIARGVGVASPDVSPGESNITAEAVEETLTQLLGISPNLNVPSPGQTRSSLSANIGHSLIYCFQHQTEIGTNQILFHRQSEDFLTQAIKDTLPYFLGAVREDHLALRQELSRLRRELRLVEQRQQESESIRGEGLSRALALLAEAEGVGLMPANSSASNLNELRTLLTQVVNWQPQQATFSGTDLLSQLQDEIALLENQRQEKSDAIRTAKAFAREAEGFSSEAQIQAARLESIGLFETEGQNHTACPLCEHALQSPTPTTEAIRRSLQLIAVDLEMVSREQPRLREYINGLEDELGVINQTKVEKQEALGLIVEQQDATRRLRDLNVRRGMVIGRVSLWLQSVPETQPGSELIGQVQDLKNQVTELEQQTASEEREERLASILNRISVQMTEWAHRLGLEFSDNPVRLDLSAATVVIDRAERPVTLQRLGAGDNWVGYHLVTHLALHKYFRTHRRPVPSFLFLDQPTQAFFPRDKDTEMQGKLESLRDYDREQVAAIFNLIFDCVAELTPNLQVVVTDHADLIDDRFQQSVVQRWRAEDEGLVPQDWPSA